VDEEDSTKKNWFFPRQPDILASILAKG